MACCGPSCTIPSCASTPVVGLGSTGCIGGFGYGYGDLGYGYGRGALAETSGNLGTLAGVVPSCISQVPPAEVVIQPPPAIVTIPGPILSSSCQPVFVGGNTPCAVGGSGIVGGYGGYGRGLLGRCWGAGFGRRGNICLSPC